MNVIDKLGLRNHNRVEKGEVVLPVGLFDGDTTIGTQKFQRV
jgi:hypothetical protein